MNAMSSKNDSDAEPMYTYMLKYNCDHSQSHPSINRREACYKICDHIKLSQTEWKGELLSMQKMGKGLYKVFKDVVNGISQVL